MKKIKVGWIGSGFVGQAAHLERFIRFENSEVVALAEIRPKLRKMVGKSFGIPHLYDHHTKLLEESDCEAVVAVVHRRHAYDVAKDVLLSGRHLLIEKPMVETVSQAADLIRAVLPNAVIVVGGPNASALPDHMLDESKAIDIIGLGDGEHTMQQRVYHCV